MVGIGCADKVIVVDAHFFPEVLEAQVVFVNVFLRGDSALFSGPLDLLPVLVGAGEEESLVSQELVEPRENVGENGRIGMPDVRGVIYIVDRSGDVKILHA